MREERKEDSAMAFENEINEQLAQIDKNNRGDYMVVSKITNKNTGTVSADIRQFYTDANGDVAPTRKGTRVNTEILPDVIKALLQLLEPDELEDIGEFIESMSADDDEFEDPEDDLGEDEDEVEA